MTSTGREEAVLVVRGWVEARALVKLELHLGPAAAGLRARVRSATADEWRFVADDGVTELMLRLRPTFTFAFKDIRDLPTDPQDFEAMLIVYFGAETADADGDQDHLAIAVISEV